MRGNNFHRWMVTCPCPTAWEIFQVSSVMESLLHFTLWVLRLSFILDQIQLIIFTLPVNHED